MVGASSFGAAIDYIVREGPEHERDHAPPLAIWSENLASIATAAREMEAVASRSRAKEPLYHLIVSFAEGERPNVRAGARGARYADRASWFRRPRMRRGAAKRRRRWPLSCARGAQPGRPAEARCARRLARPRQDARTSAWPNASRGGAWSRRRSAQSFCTERDVEYYQHKRSLERRIREELGRSQSAPAWDGEHYTVRPICRRRFRRSSRYTWHC